MITVLVGYGPNGIAIPALVFSSMEEGLLKCQELLGTDNMKNVKVNEKYEYIWMWDDEIPMDLAKKIYKDYYGGCGECYSVVLREVAEGEPFVCWDLD